ncbi:hypothetical protein FOZ63_018905, partial [Perkinsus olseni]
ETVFFGNLRSERRHSAVGAVVHTGDNLTGEGSGDDEQVILHMDQFGPTVYNIFFVINIYTRGVTFAQVANPYCRVVDASNNNFIVITHCDFPAKLEKKISFFAMCEESSAGLNPAWLLA